MDSPMYYSSQLMGVQYTGVASPAGGVNGSPSIATYYPSPYLTSTLIQNGYSSGMPISSTTGPYPMIQHYPLLFQHPGFGIEQGISKAPSISIPEDYSKSTVYQHNGSVKRVHPYSTNCYPSKYSNLDYPFTVMQSSIEELASQQLQRNEMDGMIPERIASSASHPRNYASLLVLNNPLWSSDDTTMVLYAMYRVLFQSKPDAPNELMLQIPITCSNLLPSLINQFAPCQLQNGNAVKLVMKQLAFQIQQQQIPVEPAFIDRDVIKSLQWRREQRIKHSHPDSLFRSDLVYVLLNELNTSDIRKEFYLEEYLRCLYLNNVNHADFIHSFTIYFYNHVEECLAYERSCRIGELSQLVITTRNQLGSMNVGDGMSIGVSSGKSFHNVNSGSCVSGSCINFNGGYPNLNQINGSYPNGSYPNLNHPNGSYPNGNSLNTFKHHHHLDFLLSFCSRYFIRPFPESLFLAILNFFRTSIILSTFNSISKCIYSIILTQPELAILAIRFLIRSWPIRDSSREVLYLRQVECILQIVSTEQQQRIFGMISGKMKKALKSDNRFVSLQSIQLLMRIVHTNIAIMDMKLISIFSDILTSLNHHWCDTIRQCASSCLKSMLLKAELRSSGEEEALQNREEAFTL